MAAFLVAFGALHYGFYTRNLLLDTPIYERYGDAIVHDGAVPYRDFAVEYPPGALVAFAAPSLGATEGAFDRYTTLFEALMLLCGVAAAALVAFLLVRQRAGTGRLVGGVLLAGLAPLALGPVMLSRFDLWPAALTVGALAALAIDRRRLAFALLGGAVAAKLYPAVVVPLALAYAWRRHGRRAAAEGAAIAGAVAAVCFLPFVIASPSGVWDSLTRQASRPLQIESLGSALLLAAHHAFGVGLTQESSHGSDNLAGSLPDALASLQSLLVVGVLGGAWVAFARGPADRDRLLRYSAAAVCAFIALGKVLSPQFLIWLIPLVPLVRGRRGLAAGALFAAAMVLTQLWFPRRYIDLVYGLDARASWLIVSRDLLLAALLAALLWPRGRARRTGLAVGGALVALSAGAVVAAAASGPAAPTGPVHNGLLDLTSAPTACGRRSAAPDASGGSVRYEAASFANRSARTRCAVVAVRARGDEKVFSATYLASFDASNPRINYLGDGGGCTNELGTAGEMLRYGVSVPARSRFVVEVEVCDSRGPVPPYVLTVTLGRPPAILREADATRTGAGASVRWRASHEARGVRYVVHRERDGVRTRARGVLSAGPRAAGSRAYVYRDRVASGERFRYWIEAIGRDGRRWLGPVG